MTKLLDLLGADEKISAAVKDIVQVEGEKIQVIQDKFNELVMALHTDVYTNMKSIEKQNYRMVEMETKLSNLAAFVKLHLPGGGE